MVSSYMQLLAKKYRGKLDEDADDFIALAVDGAKRMQTLIRDLLAFSGCGREEIALKPTDCSAVLQKCLQSLKLSIAEVGEVGEVVKHEPLPTISTDPVLLEQVFQNLISNAIKFRGKDALAIHVSAARIDQMWQFSVKDNGLGIEKEYTQRIFLIFQRLHTTQQYQGNGIGLAFCKKIVERLGGHIWVESTFGAGSTFHFTLPARVAVAA